MYIVYILVVGFGRCTRLTKKKKKGNFVQKNDFKSDNAKPIESVSSKIQHEMYGNENIAYEGNKKNKNETITIKNGIENGIIQAINLDPI